MSDLSTTTTRYEACQLVISGLESIRQGILAYNDLDLTINDLYDDLVKAGWSKSKSTLKRAATDLRKEGLLPESPKARTNPGQSARKSERKPVENSTPLITPEIVNHVTDVQQCYTSSSISPRVSNVQSTLDSSSNRCDKDAVSMGATLDGRAAKDHAQVNNLISQIESILERHYAPLDPGTFNGFHWTDFYEQFDSLRGRCEQYSREYRQLEKEHAEQGLSKAKLWVDSNFDSEGNRIGSNDEVLRLV